jgi:RecA-family ATPase
MPDDSLPALKEPAAVFLMSAEDGLADTIRPRLDAAGADQELISVAEGRHFLIPSDADLILEAVKQRNAKLVIIDPLAAYLDASVNSWNNQHVRRSLAPIADIAKQTDTAILVLDHLNKRSGVSAIQRGSGSIAFNAAARCVLLACKHPQEAETFVLASVKSNLGAPSASLAYRTVEAENKAVKLEWQGECPYEADELVATGFEPTNSKKLASAVEFLRARLATSSVLSKTVDKEAAERNISARTLIRARKELGVISTPLGLRGEWALSLPIKEAIGRG